jgi:O-antigen/teichoic acid export membrane protein
VLSEPAAGDGAGAQQAEVRSFGTAVALLTVVRIGSVVAGFLTSVLAARLIGADGLGLAGSAFTIATAGALLSSGGLNIAAIYFLGRRPEEQRQIVARTLTLGAAAGVLAILLVLAGSLAVRTAVLGGAGASVLAAAAALAATILVFELIGGLLLGLQRRTAYIVVQAAEALGSLALTALLLLLVDRSAASYLVAAALGYAGATAVAWLAVRRRLGPIRPDFSRAFTREALSLGLRGQVGNVLQYLSLRLDLVLVAALLDLRAAGIYFVAVRVSEVVTQVATSASAFLFPQVAAQTERRSTRVTEQITRLTLLSVVVGGVILAALAEPLLGLAFGAEFVTGADPVRITLLAMLPLTLTRVLAGDLKGRGRPGLVSWAAFVGLVATISLDLVLIPWLGIVGAALASLLSYSAGAAFMLAAYRGITGAAASALVPRPSDLRLLVELVLTRGRKRETAG